MACLTYVSMGKQERLYTFYNQGGGNSFNLCVHGALVSAKACRTCCRLTSQVVSSLLVPPLGLSRRAAAAMARDSCPVARHMLT